MEELYGEVVKIARNFKDTKFFKFFYYLLDTPLPLNTVMFQYLPSPREYLGNYKISSDKGLKRIFTVRRLTPRRLKREEFHRGYRDHGSMSSVSERARKSANSFTRPGELSNELNTPSIDKYYRPLKLRIIEEEYRDLLTSGNDPLDHDPKEV
jgi:hypothetical protein